MAKRASSQRRTRLYVDVSDAVVSRVRQIADRFFRGATNDAVVAALAAFNWMLDQRRQGKRVIAVESDELPERYSEPVLPGLDESIGGEQWTWLVARPHAWRRQLWLKGRRIRAAELVGHMRGNEWTPEETARQFDVPLGGVIESQRYVDANRELIDAETSEEQRIAHRAANVHPREAIGAPPHR